jgi:hypothetical protein
MNLFKVSRLPNLKKVKVVENSIKESDIRYNGFLKIKMALQSLHMG